MIQNHKYNCIPHILTPCSTNLISSINFPFCDFLDGSKLYMSLLKGCHIAWNVHSITVDDRNISCVRINVSKERYSAFSSSVITNRFNKQMCSPYKLKKTKQKIAWKTHFFADGIIVKFPGNNLPLGERTAITNNSFFWLLVPAQRAYMNSDNIWVYITNEFIHHMK